MTDMGWSTAIGEHREEGRAACCVDFLSFCLKAFLWGRHCLWGMDLLQRQQQV